MEITNQKYVEQIWNRFNEKLRTFIFNLVKDEATADDLLQEVFLKIHRLIGQLQDDSKLQAWVYQVARNTVYDYFRVQGRTTKIDINEIDITSEEAENQYMSDAILDMVKMMNDMPPEYCDVLCETELGGMSHREYAELRGISHTAARTRAFRARNMLKDKLMNCCHYYFDKYGTVVDIQPIGCCCCCDDKCK